MCKRVLSSWIALTIIVILISSVSVFSAEAPDDACGNWQSDYNSTGTLWIGCPGGDVERCDENGCYAGEIEYRGVGGLGFILYGYDSIWYGLSVQENGTKLYEVIYDNYGFALTDAAPFSRPGGSYDDYSSDSGSTGGCFIDSLF